MPCPRPRPRTHRAVPVPRTRRARTLAYVPCPRARAVPSPLPPCVRVRAVPVPRIRRARTPAYVLCPQAGATRRHVCTCLRARTHRAHHARTVPALCPPLRTRRLPSTAPRPLTPVPAHAPCPRQPASQHALARTRSASLTPSSSLLLQLAGASSAAPTPIYRRLSLSHNHGFRVGRSREELPAACRLYRATCASALAAHGHVTQDPPHRTARDTH
ncbi:hypothetical protein GGX14DRAFT_573159 [Mycena pura]|uniref:Uncharacterized protein n=1 Tax=Mycena pura TaxID=153505 RepID=A0AAD6Y802_9AGAR|nr:hypothetical protein GGX14DRAFT_573159 [Mycena pura]